MVRNLLLGAVAVAGLTAIPVLRAEETREVSIQASVFAGPQEAGLGPVQLREQGGVVIRSPQDLVAMSNKPDAAKDASVRKELEAELAKALDVTTIDWKTQMVIAVRGEVGTRLDRIHFESLKLEGKVLTVGWKVKQRPPHAGPGTPVALILVERCDEVKFVEAGQK